MDIFICETSHLGKGLATKVIQDFLTSQFPFATDFTIDPELKNERAIHVYKKVGYIPVSQFIASWHPVPHLMMHITAHNLKRKYSE